MEGFHHAWLLEGSFLASWEFRKLNCKTATPSSICEPHVVQQNVQELTAEATFT